MLGAMLRAVECTHMGFPHQITGKWDMLQADGVWETPPAEEVLWESWMQSVSKYIGLWQAMVAQLMALISELKVCLQENIYQRGEGRDEHGGDRGR